MMQAGFATLSAGSIRAKNVKNILLKNVLDACVGAILWYCVGYGLAYDADNGVNGPCNAASRDTLIGPGSSECVVVLSSCHVRAGHKALSFIGSGPTNFALSSIGDHSGQDKGKTWIMWQFQYAFAASAATIVSGAVAERCQLGAYLIYTAVITGFVYPVVVHWVWDPAGFLSAFNSDDSVRIYTGCTDFAGSCVVHMVGGWAALVAAWVLGPRIGRWERPELFEGHSTPLVIIGTFLLWFGWYVPCRRALSTCPAQPPTA